MNRIHIIGLIFSALIVSCSPKNIPGLYYKNQLAFDSIHKNYSSLINENSFTIFFKDRSYKKISIEIFTDSIRYVYNFKITDLNLLDTLVKYKIRPKDFYLLMDQMRRAGSLWIAKLEYYVATQKDSVIYISLRSKPLRFFFSNKKYYMINWFYKKQYYNDAGILLDQQHQPTARELNDRISYRINDTVAYRISNRFR